MASKNKRLAFTTVEEALTHYLPKYPRRPIVEDEKAAGIRAGRRLAEELHQQLKDALAKPGGARKASKRPKSKSAAKGGRKRAS